MKTPQNDRFKGRVIRKVMRGKKQQKTHARKKDKKNSAKKKTEKSRAPAKTKSYTSMGKQNFQHQLQNPLPQLAPPPPPITFSGKCNTINFLVTLSTKLITEDGT